MPPSKPRIRQTGRYDEVTTDSNSSVNVNMFKLLSSSESDSGKEVLNKNSKVKNETLGWLRSKSAMPLKNPRKRQKGGDDELVTNSTSSVNVKRSKFRSSNESCLEVNLWDTLPVKRSSEDMQSTQPGLSKNLKTPKVQTAVAYSPIENIGMSFSTSSVEAGKFINCGMKEMLVKEREARLNFRPGKCNFKLKNKEGMFTIEQSFYKSLRSWFRLSFRDKKVANKDRNNMLRTIMMYLRTEDLHEIDNIQVLFKKNVWDKYGISNVQMYDLACRIYIAEGVVNGVHGLPSNIGITPLTKGQEIKRGLKNNIPTPIIDGEVVHWVDKKMMIEF